jgi:hypothetical protein
VRFGRLRNRLTGRNARNFDITIASCHVGVYAKQSPEKLGVWDKALSKLARADTIRRALFPSRAAKRISASFMRPTRRPNPRLRFVDTFPGSTQSPFVYTLKESRDGGVFCRRRPRPGYLLDQGFKILSK